jgi:hypothetical protein
MFHFLQQARHWRMKRELNRLHIELAGRFDYLRRASRCRTQNEFNRLHIELENILTPLELAGIAKLAKMSTSPEPSRLWLERIQKWKPELFESPQGYERRSFSRHVTLYQNPKGEAHDKGLLVAFSGDARRLMMPTSVFLQFVDSRMWDVVVLKKGSRNSYLLGLDSVATDFHGLVEYLQTTFTPAQYRRVMTLGTSSGGFAAAWAAFLMGADRGISVGGGPPRPLPALTAGDQPAPDGVDLCYVYGMDCPQDHQAALLLLDIFGGRLRPVPDIDAHGVLSRLLKSGKLAEFLDEMLA